MTDKLLLNKINIVNDNNNNTIISLNKNCNNILRFTSDNLYINSNSYVQNDDVINTNGIITLKTGSNTYDYNCEVSDYKLELLLNYYSSTAYNYYIDENKDYHLFYISIYDCNISTAGVYSIEKITVKNKVYKPYSLVPYSSAYVYNGSKYTKITYNSSIGHAMITNLSNNIFFKNIIKCNGDSDRYTISPSQLSTGTYNIYIQMALFEIEKST